MNVIASIQIRIGNLLFSIPVPRLLLVQKLKEVHWKDF